MVVHYTKQQFNNDRDIHLNPLTWWKEGLFGWLLVDVEKLESPVAWRGQLGLYTINGVIH